jgi:rod shape-determining protein MreC
MVVARRETRPRTVLILVLVTSLVLITLDSRGNGVIDGIRDVARDVIAPVQDGVDSAFSPISDTVDGVTSYGSVKDENARLKRKVAQLEGKILRQRAAGADISDLQKLVDLPRIEDATGVVARVSGGSPGNFERTVQLDRGSNAGVGVGEPVVAADGLVGKVTQVSRTRSTVTLIDDPSLGVGVRFEKSNVRGITQARSGEREMRINNLPDLLVKPAKGELLFTSASEDAVFPGDIPVAKVVKYVKRPGDIEPQITVLPVVNLDELQFVKVLRPPSTKASGGGGK